MASDGTALRFDNVNYTAANERVFSTILAFPAGGTSFLRARAGIRPSSGLTVTVDSTGDGTVTVQGGSGIITDAGAGDGSYLFYISSAVSKALTTRPTSGQSRLVEVVVKLLNGDERIGDGVGVREVDIAIISGTASAGTPTAPTIPSGQLRLAELVVPASGAITVQNPAARTVALGGILPVSSQAERDAAAQYDGAMYYREDLDIWQGRANGGWVDIVGKQDTGWSNISLHSGFTAQSGATPKKRTVRGNEVKLKGRVNGTFATSADVVIADAGSVPSPPEQVEKQISVQSADRSCRAFITTDGAIHVVTGSLAPTYVYLDGLSGYMLD